MHLPSITTLSKSRSNSRSRSQNSLRKESSWSATTRRKRAASRLVRKTRDLSHRKGALTTTRTRSSKSFWNICRLSERSAPRRNSTNSSLLQADSNHTGSVAMTTTTNYLKPRTLTVAKGNANNNMTKLLTKSLRRFFKLCKMQMCGSGSTTQSRKQMCPTTASTSRNQSA